MIEINKKIVDYEEYISLLNMINVGNEDKTLAFACLSKLPIKENWLIISLLRIESNTIIKEWIDHCHGHMLYQQQIGLPETEVLQFFHILTVFLKTAPSKNEAIIFTKRYENFVKNSIERINFVRKADIKLTTTYDNL